MWRTRVLIVALMLLLPGIAASAPPADADPPETGCRLIYAETARLTQVFPYYLKQAADRRVWDLLFEPLARRAGSGVSFTSTLLDFTRAVMSKDSTAWTFPLLTSFWHSDRAFGPDDIIRTFRKLKELDQSGHEDWTQELDYLRSMKEITTDGKSITVRYTGPIRFEVAKESLSNFFVIPWGDLPDLCTKFDSSLVDWTPQATSIKKDLPGNGRWMSPPGQSLTTREGGIRLVSFDRFPGGASPIHSIESRVQPVPSMQVNSLKNGSINLLLSVPHSSLQEVRRWPGVQVQALAQNSFTSIIICKQRTPALRHKQVREALIYAINREVILDAEFGGNGEILESPYTAKCSFYTNKYAQRRFDPDRAKALLREAGFEWRSQDDTWHGPQGEQLNQLVFLAEESLEGSEMSLTFDRVIADWRSINIPVEIKLVPPAELQSNLETGNYDFYLKTCNWSGPGSMRRLLSCNVNDHPENRHFICSPEVEQLLTEFESDEATRDPLRRNTIGSQLHETIYETCDRIYLWSLHNYAAFQSDSLIFVDMGMTLFENPGLWKCE